VTANNQKLFIIDFDSTFTKVEALDELCEISLKDDPRKDQILEEIISITNKGMAGEISLRQSLEDRIRLIKAHEKHIPVLIETLSKKITKSFVRNKSFFQENHDHVYIVSNGFKEFISPVVEQYGIDPSHVLANTFTYDESGNIIGFDKKNALSENQGKAKKIGELGLEGEVLVIGDGHTDYEIKSAGKASQFFAFTENVERANVMANADHVAPSLDEILYVNKMNKELSYPKNRIKVLLVEGIHQEAANKFREEGFTVELIASGLDEDELIDKIKDVSILGIRSKTQITERVLENAPRLLALGAFCIGTNQIDLEACLNNGVAVFNAPYSNTRSVVELAIAEMILLLRNIPNKIIGMHLGNWDKSSVNSNEIRNSTLGLIGYGNIGSQLSVLAEAIGIRVQYYDVDEKLALGNATKCDTLDQLLENSDIISLHVDGRPENVGLIGEAQFIKMRDGVIFINLSRGKVVDIDALKLNIESGKVRGAAIDVFPTEPKNNNQPFQSVLKGLPNTILTPHIGGSTHEAQINIASFVPEMLIRFINTGNTSASVNFPRLKLKIIENGHRLIHIHKNESGVLGKIDQCLGEHNINIIGQYLKTNESIGYVITDIDKKYPKSVINQLKKIEGSIRVRVLY
jgi:D-3-phosphoglycerate dehydrogenase / 2-oxoglutarate reductase